MSLQLEFEPHSWYMSYALRITPTTRTKWQGIRYDGTRGTWCTLEADTLRELKQKIRRHHLERRNGYGERIARRRLEYLRGEIHAERISYGEQAELAELADYIEPGDVELLEWAGVPEAKR